MADIIDNINMVELEKTENKIKSSGGHLFVEKHINGEFNLSGSPMFTAELGSEKAKFILGADEPGILGGQGVHATPLNYLMMGVMSCFASTVAIQAAKRGIVLKKLKFKGHLYYDIGPVVVESDFPIIKSLKIEVEADQDIKVVLEHSKKACPALYAIMNPIPTEISQL